MMNNPLHSSSVIGVITVIAPRGFGLITVLPYRGHRKQSFFGAVARCGVTLSRCAALEVSYE